MARIGMSLEQHCLYCDSSSLCPLKEVESSAVGARSLRRIITTAAARLLTVSEFTVKRRKAVRVFCSAGVAPPATEREKGRIVFYNIPKRK